MPKSPARKPAAKREYLSRDRRKRSLLDAAAAIVERDGWSALTMSALAEAAGTSRQLIYQHFNSQEKLLAGTAWHIFNETMSGTQASVAAHPTNLAEAALAAEAVTLDLPPGRANALWQLIAGTASATPELEKVRLGLRELITGIWTPLVRKELGMTTADAKAYAWMMIMSFWGMRQLVGDGELPRTRGVKLFNQMIEQVRRR